MGTVQGGGKDKAGPSMEEGQLLIAASRGRRGGNETEGAAKFLVIERGSSLAHLALLLSLFH